MIRLLVVVSICLTTAIGQTVINGSRDIRGDWIASSANSTRPAKVGTTLPAACVAGEQFFKSDATAGQNVYLCTATNVWTQTGATSVLSFSGVTAGTNTTALVVGTAGSLTVSGSGTITATDGDSATSFFAAGAIEKARQHAATVYGDQANIFTAGAKQTVSQSATTAGLNFGTGTVDPSAPTQGDFWVNTDLLKLRVATATKTLAFTDSNITGNAATATTATALAANPADCGANSFATTIAANGDLTCAQPAFTNLSGSATLAQLPFGTANQLIKTNAGGTAEEQSTLAVGTAGTDFAVAFGVGSITLNLPSASAANRGALLSADWSAFSAKAGGSANLTIAGQITCVDSAGVIEECNAAATPAITKLALGTTSTDGLALINSTAAAAGAQQISPRLHFSARGWKTDATAASQAVDWIAELVPVQGAANPQARLDFNYSINAGAYTNAVSFLNGNIGVGTAIPLHGVVIDRISGSTSAAMSFYQGGAFRSIINGAIGSAGAILTGTAPDDMAIASAQKILLGGINQPAVVTITTGSVGIGPSNTSPTGTLHVFNATAVTGVTTQTIKAGAGQGATTLWQVVDNVGGLVARLESSSLFRIRSDIALTDTVDLRASSILRWSNIADDYTATKDTGIGRNAAGVIEINGGSAGTFRDLKLRAIELTGGVVQDGDGWKHQSVTTGSIALSSSAAVTLTWTSGFADSSYSPHCSVLQSTAGTDTLRVHHIESISSTAIVVRVVNDSGADARTGTLYCMGIHN